MHVDLLDLETAIKAMSGVLGCVIFSGPEGEPTQIQAFVRRGVGRDEVRRAIEGELETRGLDLARIDILVSDLEAETSLADIAADVLSAAPDDADDPIAALERRLSAAAGRPAIRRVALTSTAGRVEAEVVLAGMPPGTAGRAEGDKSSRGLEVVASATLDAVHRLVGGGRFSVEHASVVATSAGDAALVFVRAGEDNLVGAAVVRDDPLADVVVRATLAAVNRVIGRPS
jgi:hypothetical protein